MTEPLLEVKGLSVSYVGDQGRVRALDNVTLTIRRGSVRGIIGESGCGKSTLAKSILGILPSSALVEKGEIFIQNEDIVNMPRKELSNLRGKIMALIPQDPSDSLNPVFTIGTQMWDIVAPKRLNKKALFYKPKEKRDVTRLFIDKMLQVQLPSPPRLLNSYPHELSGGQKQRILIAIALLVNPLILVADEPTTSLDVTVEAQIIHLLETLVRKNRTTTIFITHNLAVANKICDCITVMYCGQIMESAPTESFFSKPIHPYSVKLIESLPKIGSALKDIPGIIPSLVDPPSGCRFHPRCDHAVDKCSIERPPQKQVAPDHWVFCYNP
jgi:peptide/nickel transport system ATP-binding protein